MSSGQYSEARDKDDSATSSTVPRQSPFPQYALPPPSAPPTSSYFMQPAPPATALTSSHFMTSNPSAAAPTSSRFTPAAPPNSSPTQSTGRVSSTLSPTAPIFVPSMSSTSPDYLTASLGIAPMSPDFPLALPPALGPFPPFLGPTSSLFLGSAPDAYSPAAQFFPPGPQEYPSTAQFLPGHPQSVAGLPYSHCRSHQHLPSHTPPNLPSMAQQVAVHYPHYLVPSPTDSTPWSYSPTPPTFSTTATQFETAPQQLDGAIGSYRLLLAVFDGAVWRFHHPGGLAVNEPLRSVPKRARFVRLQTDPGLRAFLEDTMNQEAYAAWTIAAVMEAGYGNEIAANVWIVKRR